MAAASMANTNPARKANFSYYTRDLGQNSKRITLNRAVRTWESLLQQLTDKCPDLNGYIRAIRTPVGGRTVCTLEELEDNKTYLCMTERTRFKQLQQLT